MMEIIVGKMAGFCGGVSNAVEKAKEELENTTYKTVYCLGELVHNHEVMRQLSQKGLQIIENIEQGSEKVIVRAHGITKQIYAEAKQRGVNLVDLTCKKVLKIHDMAENYAKKGYYIFLIGDKQHPEVIGTYSFCGEYATIINEEKEIVQAVKMFKQSNIQKLVVLAQTTYSMEKFDKMIKIIEEKIPNKTEYIVHKTICEATRLRQEETSRISMQVEGMIIIGGKNSSNTKKLYEIAKQNCKNVVLVESQKEIVPEQWSGCEKIGIMAGASTPKESIEDIIKILENCVICV